MKTEVGCPFCGGLEISIDEVAGRDDLGNYWHDECSSCGALGPKKRRDMVRSPELWERRKGKVGHLFRICDNCNKEYHVAEIHQGEDLKITKAHCHQCNEFDDVWLRIQPS